MGEDREARIEALDHHAHIGPRIWCCHHGKLVPLRYLRSNRTGRLGPELLDELRLDVELYDLSFGITFQRLMESLIPTAAEPQES